MSTLPPYSSRPRTPSVSEPPALVYESNHSRNTSSSSTWSVYSSPGSDDTNATSPSRSPIRRHGPILLPRVRAQDQSVEPAYRVSKSHRRTLSSTCNPPGLARSVARPSVQRSTTSPPDCISLISPVSATSHFSLGSYNNSTLSSPITVTSSFSQGRDAHSRSTSACSINDVTLGRFGYPTYRRAPAYITGVQYSASFTPGSSTFIPPPPPTPPPSSFYEIAEELEYEGRDDPQTSLRQYLTGPNPTVMLVPKDSVEGREDVHTHFWWDIRNTEVWQDFNLQTIEAVPDFSALLDVPVSAAAYGTPNIAQSRLQPRSVGALQEICSEFYATKVTAALKASLGKHNYIQMRAQKPRDGPHFVSTYQNDIERAMAGNGRGRVVGLVKSFDRWNTGMRHGNPVKQVDYLQHLSHLHHYMREHQCRYGFIITEIELVCVRAGTEGTPYFGHLELSPAIELAAQEGLTACLALWYLHMLAKEKSLPGQCGWQLDIGPPSLLTRSHVMGERDPWMPKPLEGERKTAKRKRGWVFPEDPYNKKTEKARVWNRW